VKIRDKEKNSKKLHLPKKRNKCLAVFFVAKHLFFFDKNG